MRSAKRHFWASIVVAGPLAATAAACAREPSSPATTRSAAQGSQTAATPATPPPVTAHGHGAVPSLAEAAAEAKKIDNLGTYGRPVDTDVAEAQAFFDQGMRLYWAFNHDEAYRSFARAAQLDPKCAMCAWGAALTLGPNYNMPMLPDREKAAWEALQRAHMLAPSARPVDRALIGALGERYKGAAPVDAAIMGQRNIAYATAMRQVARQYPADADAQALFAEALMVENPWKLWNKDGAPAPGTPEIVATLEATLAVAPSHPGANHLYIHAVEASRDPGRGVPSAARLESAMPNAGHLVHMPAHIYQRVGRYDDAAEANRRAIQADRRYVEIIAPRTPPHVYEMYMGHNFQFLAYSDSMQGYGEEALAAARDGGRVAREAVLAKPQIELFGALPHITMLRFGRSADVLAEPPPDPAYLTATGLWHHARGMALAALSRPAEAQRELDKLVDASVALPPDHPAMNNKAANVLAIAILVLDGKIAAKRGDITAAVTKLREAARQEDALAYDEPPEWWYPVRHVLGAVQLAAWNGREAEAVYRADLAIHPENGWSLIGLAKALEMQGKAAEGKAVRARARAAWRRADIPLAGSWLDPT